MSAIGVPAPAGATLALPRSRRLAIVAGALIVSRLLVVAAGAFGVLALGKHDRAAAAAALQSLGPVGNVLAGSVDRFDAAYYLSIAAHGYGVGASDLLAFYPAYPMLIRAVTPVAGSALVSAAAISLASFAGAMSLLHRLTERELGPAAADATTIMLCFAPLSFFFTAAYTESLFLLASVATVAASRAGRWRLACVLAGAATLTRPTGVLLVVALVVGRLRERGRPERGLLWALTPPFVLGGYVAAQSLAGHPLLAVLAAQGHWRRALVGPVIGVAEGVWQALRGLARIAGGTIPVYRPSLVGPLSPGAESIVLLAVLALAVAATVACWRRLPSEYGIYCAVVLAVCVSEPWAGQPLWSLDRFVLTLFPLWMVAGSWLSRRRPAVRRGALALSALALAFYTAQFASWAFIA